MGVGILWALRTFEVLLRAENFSIREAASGYASLNLPGWVTIEPYEVSAVVYVWDTDIEQGKELLKKALLQEVNRYIERYETLKKAIHAEA